MGREALCHAEWPGGAGEVKAHLETRELVLRGDLRRTLRVSDLADVRVDGDLLRFEHAGERIALTLGAAAAASWAAKIATPPPTLAAKLGIAAGTRVRVVGAVDDADLAAALAEGIAVPGDLTVAQIANEGDLLAAVTAADGPLWLAYVRGKASPYGEGAVRAAMRDRGWIDIKVASVSDRLSATKFVPRARER